MNDVVYLFAAYAVFWALTFLLVLSIWLRQRRVEKTIDRLQARIESSDRDAQGEL
jgi:uncharacterized membrane protein